MNYAYIETVFVVPIVGIQYNLQLSTYIMILFFFVGQITEIIGKAVEEEARAQLAAEKRTMRGAAEQWRRQLELLHALKRADEAGKRRNAMLRDASQVGTIHYLPRPYRFRGLLGKNARVPTVQYLDLYAVAFSWTGHFISLQALDLLPCHFLPISIFWRSKYKCCYRNALKMQ